MFLINEGIMYNKKMKSGKAWGKEIDRMYSMRPVEKSVENVENS